MSPWKDNLCCRSASHLLDMKGIVPVAALDDSEASIVDMPSRQQLVLMDRLALCMNRC
jgi:hypothetical protein